MSLYSRALSHGVNRLISLPRLSIPVVTTLGLTLAAILTVVALINHLILRPLPDIHDESQLVNIKYDVTYSSQVSFPIMNSHMAASLARYRKGLGEVASTAIANRDFKHNGQNYAVVSFKASDNFPQVVGGGQLLIGELPTINNLQNGVWISESVWQSAFSSDSNVIGQSLELENQSLIIKGVWSDFSSYSKTNGERLTQQVWQYYNMDKLASKPPTHLLYNSDANNMHHYYRVKQQAIDMEALDQFYKNYIDSIFLKQYPDVSDFFKAWHSKGDVITYRQSVIGNKQTTMIWLLLVIVTALMLMASINLLNAFISHYQQRRQEFATQYCMGASKARLFLMSALESLPMFFLAGVVGLLGTAWFIRILPDISGSALHPLDLIHLDSFTITIAITIIALLNGLFAWLSTRQFDAQNLVSQMNTSNKGVAANGATTTSKILFSLQFALATSLLTGASMLAHKAYNTLYPELGFTPGNTLAINISLNRGSVQRLQDIKDEEMRKREEQRRDQQALQSQADMLSYLTEKFPNLMPIYSISDPYTFRYYIHSYTDDDGNTHSYLSSKVAHDYLERFDIPLLTGRNITQEDYQNQNLVLLLERSSVKVLFPKHNLQSVIGQVIDGHKVIGVVENTYRQESLVKLPRVLSSQLDSSSDLLVQLPDGQPFKRTAIESALLAFDPRIEKVKLELLEEIWQQRTEAERIQFYGIIALTILTLVLAFVGTTGLATSFAGVKRFEIAMRMALGATRIMVLRLTMFAMLKLLAIAILVALFITCSLYLFLQQWFIEIQSLSWLALSLFGGLLFAMVLAAMLRVTWQVINKDPMITLKDL